MKIAITNTTTHTINTPVVAPEYAGATSPGHLVDALPSPFHLNGEIAAGATKEFACSPNDLVRKPNFASALLPFEELQAMIRAGIITVVVTDQTGITPYGAFDELFDIAVG